MEYDFSGTWFDVELTMVVIQDGIMCGFEGSPIDLVTEGPSCAFKSGDATYRGNLMNPDHILWDDGEEWVRGGAPGAPEVTAEEVATEDKLRQKIHVFLQKRSAEQRAREAKEEKERERAKGSADVRGSMASPERALQNPGMQGFEDAKARSQAGIDRARQAFEAEKARKALALERARAAKAQQSVAAEEAPPADLPSPTGRPRRPAQEVPERPSMSAQALRPDPADASQPRRRPGQEAPERPSPPARQAAPAPTAVQRDLAARDPLGAREPREPGGAPGGGMDRARQMFEKEKARKAAALERARAHGSSAAEEPAAAESAPPVQDFEQARARSEAGIDRARKAFEEEKARKAAALERARAKASARVTDSQPPEEEAPPRQESVGGGRPGAARQVGSVGYPGGPAARRQEPRQEEFSQGQFVKIKGLGSQPELNGQIATLVKYIEDKNRWQARIPGRPSILIKTENMEQATAEEKASARRSPGPPQSRATKGKGGGKDPLPQCVVQIGPGESGNKFDVRLAEEKSMGAALEKLVGALARRGVCTCEANAPVELIDAAYQEASDLWKGGEFGPPLAHMEGQPEEKIWQDVLFQSEEKVFWIREDLSGPRIMHGLKVLSQNIWDLCLVLAEELFHQMGIGYTSYWSAMLSCYHGDKTYNLHLDNPNGADQSGIPDNGLRLSLCYFLNPFWEPSGNAVTNCGGGLDIHLTEPWETPSSLLVARKAPVMRVAPHADTLVVFLSQRMAHRVIATQGNSKWFALWVYCYDEQVKRNFDREAGELVKDVF